MPNLPLLLLLWLAVPYAIYRSKKKWMTFFLTVLTWIGSMLLLVLASSLLVTRGNAEGWSYRKVAHEMFLAVAAKYPALAKYFRVTDVNKPIDLLKR